MVSRLSRDQAATWLVAFVVALAAILALGHAAGTLRGLNETAKRNDASSDIGRTIAAADPLGMDDGWTVAAVELVTPGSTYAVVMPSRAVIANGKMEEITYDAAPLYLRDLLLPARPAPVSTARFILCYGCTRRFHDVHWIWTGGPDAKFPGLKIGRRGD